MAQRWFCKRRPAVASQRRSSISRRNTKIKIVKALGSTCASKTSSIKNDEALRALEEILNRRVWTEAVLFAAEKPKGEDGYDATAHVVQREGGQSAYFFRRAPFTNE